MGTLGRIDVCMSSWSCSASEQPHDEGHLDRAKRLVKILYKMKHASIRYDTDAPDMSQFQDPGIMGQVCLWGG
jgi:hypothetical protein